MQKIILRKLQHIIEEFIAEEQAGFRVRRSTSEHIINLRLSWKNIPYKNIAKKLSIEYGTKNYA